MIFGVEIFVIFQLIRAKKFYPEMKFFPKSYGSNYCADEYPLEDS
jgi:hypothetical protein